MTTMATALRSSVQLDAIQFMHVAVEVGNQADKMAQNVNKATTAIGTGFSAADRSMLKAAQSTEQLTTKIGLQNRQLEIMKTELASTIAKEGEEALVSQKRALAVDKLNASISQNESKLHGVQQALDAEAASAAHAATATNEMDKAAEHGGTSLGKMGELAKGALAGIGFAAVNAGLNAVSSAFTSVEHSIIGTNAQLQDSATSWGILLGSADKAQAKLDSLSKFAAVTPFDFPEVDHAAKLMETFGGAALNTVKTLTLVGDVASGVNQPFSEVAMWVGRMYSAIQAGRPFGEASARLQEMGAMSGTTRNQLEDLQKSGAAGSQIWDTFTASMSRYSGMMAKTSQNWSGLTSTFADSINLLAAKAGKPIFAALSTDLSKVNDLLASPAAEQAATHFAELASDGVQKAVDGLGDLYKVGQTTASFLDGNLGPAVQAVEAATAAYALRSLPAAIAELKTFVTLSDAAKLSLTTTYLPLALLAGEFFLAAKGGQELNEKLQALAMQQEGHNKTFQRSSEVLQGVNADYGSMTPAVRTLADDLEALRQKQVDYLAVASRRGGGVAGAEAMREAQKAAAELNPQIADLTDRLDMMAGAAQHMEWDKLNPPKGVWSAYSGEIAQAVTATKALEAMPLTGDELKQYEKIIEETTKAGQAAFNGLFDAQQQYSSNSASLATKHWQTIAAIDAELHGKITKARRAELGQQRAAEVTDYAQQTQDLKNALADQIAAQRQALGTMLRERLQADRGTPGADTAKVDALIADTEKRYGLLPDRAAEASDQALQIIEEGIRKNSGLTAGQIASDVEQVQRSAQDMGKSFDSIRDLLVLQVKTEMVGRSPADVAAAITGAWSAANATINAFPELAGRTFKSIDDLKIATAQTLLLRVHAEADTGEATTAIGAVKAQLDLIDRHPIVHISVTADQVPALHTTGSAYSGQPTPAPRPRPSPTPVPIAGSIHGQSIGGVDVYGAQAQAVDLHASIDAFVADSDYVLKKVSAMAAKYKSDGLKHTAEYADAADKMMGLIGHGIDAFGRLDTYKHVSTDAVGVFASDVDVTVQTLGKAAGHFKDKALEHMALYADTAGKVLSMAGTGADALAKIATYKGVTRDAVLLFGNDVYGTTATLAVIVQDFDRDALAAAADWSESAGKVLSVIGSGVDGMTKLSAYKGVTRNAVLQFGFDVYGTVTTLQVITRDFDHDGVKAAAEWAESAGKVIGIIGSGVDGFTKLATYKGVAPKLVWDFEHDVKEAVWALDSVARDFNQDGVKAAADWADSAGKIVAVIGPAVDGLTKINDYTGLMPGALDTLVHDTDVLIRKIVDVAGHVNKEGVKAAADFADAEGRIVGPIITTIQAFDAINKYKGVARDAVIGFADDMVGVVGTIVAVDALLNTDGVKAAASVAADEQTIFSALSAGLSFFKELGDRKKSDIPAEVALLQSDMHEVVVAVENMQTFAAIAAVDVLAWKVSMESIVRNVKAGAASLGSLDGLNVDATVTLGIHERTKVQAVGGVGGVGGGGINFFGAPDHAAGAPQGPDDVYTPAMTSGRGQGGDTHNHWAIDLRGSSLTEHQVKRAIEDVLREKDRRFGERRKG